MSSSNNSLKFHKILSSIASDSYDHCLGSGYDQSDRVNVVSALDSQRQVASHSVTLVHPATTIPPSYTTSFTSHHTIDNTDIMSDDEDMYESMSDGSGSDLDMVDGTQESDSGKPLVVRAHSLAD